MVLEYLLFGAAHTLPPWRWQRSESLQFIGFLSDPNIASTPIVLLRDLIQLFKVFLSLSLSLL